MNSPQSGPDLELATVESEIRALERLLASTAQVVASEVSEHRRRQLDTLLVRREALRLKADVDETPLAHVGLWEPLPLYPGGEAPQETGAAAVSKPVRSGLERDAREALSRLGALYLGRRKSDPVKTLTGALNAPFARLIRDVAMAVGRDFGLYSVIEAAGLKVSRWHLDEPVPLVSEGSSDRIPDAVGGLTASQLQVLGTFYFADDAGDLTSTVAELADESAAFGAAMTEAAVVEAILPLTAEGAARYPLLELAHGRLRVTPFGKDVLIPSRESKTVMTRLPLLLVLGHNGSPRCPPHHLGEVVEVVCSMLKREVDFKPLKADPTYGGTIIDNGAVLEMPPDLTVFVSRRTFNARIEIRNLPPHTSPGAIASFAASRFATGEDGTGYVQQGPDGQVTIFVDHVAFVTDLVRRLRSAGVTHRFERIALSGIQAGKVCQLTTGEVCRNFVEASISRLSSEASDRLIALNEQLHVIEGRVVGSVLHSVVDQIAAAADDEADAIWGLTHFRSAELSSHPSYRWVKIETAELDAKCADLTARVPELANTIKAFSVEQAKALFKEKRLASQQASTLVAWRAKRAEIAQLEAGLTVDQLTSQLGEQLQTLVKTHGDSRRARVLEYDRPAWVVADW
jgi:hypothetical protein